MIEPQGTIAAKSRVRTGRVLALALTLFAAVIAALAGPVAGLAGAQEAVTEITVGALLDQSGPRMSQDRLVEAALKVAADEINAHLEAAGRPFRLALRVGDTRTDPDHALLQLQAMAQEGVRFVVGPSTSQELFRVRPYAQTQGILLVSPSSTAPSLAVPGDLVFRMVPDDTRQGRVLADRMWRDGIRAVVPIMRDDLYAKDLVHFTREAFESRNIIFDFGGAPGGAGCRLMPIEGSLPLQVCGGVVYNPRTVDFIAEVQSLTDIVAEAVRAYGARRVAVLLIAFEEAVPIFVQAATSPILSLVRWYGADASAKSPAIAGHEGAARFASGVSFTASIAAEAQGRVFSALSDAVRRLTGSDADANAAAAYDALWLIARAIESEGPVASPSRIAQALPRAAQGYAGASGSVRFNAAGDRDSDSFDFWRLERRGEAYVWSQVR